MQPWTNGSAGMTSEWFILLNLEDLSRLSWAARSFSSQNTPAKLCRCTFPLGWVTWLRYSGVASCQRSAETRLCCLTVTDPLKNLMFFVSGCMCKSIPRWRIPVIFSQIINPPPPSSKRLEFMVLLSWFCQHTVELKHVLCCGLASPVLPVFVSCPEANGTSQRWWLLFYERWRESRSANGL